MLSTLKRIVQEVSSARDLPQALQTMVEQVANAIQTEACSVYLTDKKNEQYILGAQVGFPSGCHFVIADSQGLVGLVGRRAEPINLSDASNHPDYHYVPQTNEERFKAFLGVPIIHQREVVGILVVQQRESRKFDEGEEAFLITVSAQLAGVIAHARVAGMLSLEQNPSGIQERTFKGLPGSAGVAIGEAVVTYALSDLGHVPNREIEDIEQEQKKFLRALAATRTDIKRMRKRLQKTLPPEERSLFDAYLYILDSNTFAKEVLTGIQAKQWAAGALREAVMRHVAVFEAMDDPYLQERASDVKDLGRRILAHLQKKHDKDRRYPDKTILVGEEITASLLAEVPEDKLAGIVSAKGSHNAHVAILARAMGMPAVMGAKGAGVLVSEGDKLIVDGYNGTICINPGTTLLSEYQRLAAEEEELYSGLVRLRNQPAQTPDGRRIQMLVNVGLVADIRPSIQAGAEGVGLYRTEVPFMIRDRFPSEDEQYLIYRQLLESFMPRLVTMRTLDVGADKPLPYFNTTEDNPALGWRGLRMTLDHPEIFLVQLRAMLKASHQLNNLQIMLPMVTSVAEVIEAKRLIQQAYDEVRQEGADIQFPRIGAMIEIPSAIYVMPELATLVDFFSVGSNDLTQYLLAVDRNNTQVATLYDALHPAMLRALQQIVTIAHRYKRSVSICGEMAADPASAILLIAIGFDMLSISATSLPRVKWVVRSFKLQVARGLLKKALGLVHPSEVRQLLNEALEKAGLGGLVRAGK